MGPRSLFVQWVLCLIRPRFLWVGELPIQTWLGEKGDPSHKCLGLLLAEASFRLQSLRMFTVMGKTWASCLWLHLMPSYHHLEPMETYGRGTNMVYPDNMPKSEFS